VRNAFLLLAGENKFDEKIRLSAALAALSNFVRALCGTPIKISIVRVFGFNGLEVGEHTIPADTSSKLVIIL
jgi:hypothetical protein